MGDSNRQNLPKGTMTDEGRRDVPVGATEPQWHWKLEINFITSEKISDYVE